MLSTDPVKPAKIVKAAAKAIFLRWILEHVVALWSDGQVRRMPARPGAAAVAAHLRNAVVHSLAA